MIRLSQEVCRDLDSALAKEWLEVNGLGGFASSTIVGLNTRRYHGLLVAATKPPAGRVVMLSKLEEALVVGERRFELSANRYPGTVHPQGLQFLREFRLDPFPTFVYEVEGLELQKSIFMVHGENTTVVEYALRRTQPDAPTGCVLEVRPLIAFRDYHNTTHANGVLNPSVETAPGLASVKPYEDLPALYFAHTADEIVTQGGWYYNFEYDVERERGLDFLEDLFHPLTLRFDLARARAAAVIASTDPKDARKAAGLREAEVARRRAVAQRSPLEEPFVRVLTQAAEQFIVQRGDLKSVIAGYHWFADWGRDTMIALPGLTLTTGQPEIARNVLLAFAQHVDRGMLPNRFPDAGEAPEYNTVDAALWFFEAIRAFVEKTGDDQFVKTRLYSALRDIIEWHVRGTRYGIQMDTDGLLNAGAPAVQLTWMDAKVGDWVVTPRHGKPVEIQALWHNALCIMRELAERFGDGAAEAKYRSMAAQTSESFNNSFWNEEAGCLFDVVGREGQDGSIRPNQIFAVSLRHTMLSADRARSVVGVAERDLLTPYGLRTLARGDNQYRPRYEGDPGSRDGSYHQGTVWPWLLGPFITAYLRVHGGALEARQRAAQWLKPLEEHLQEACLGQVSEIFDADLPHRPRGCVAQAWSVAELLRVAVENVFRPDLKAASEGSEAISMIEQPASAQSARGAPVR
jgi:predicted glycogen debranching enzyme